MLHIEMEKEKSVKRASTLNTLKKQLRLMMVLVMGICCSLEAATVSIATTNGAGGISGQYDVDGSAFGGTQWHVKNKDLLAGTRKGCIRFDTSAIDFTATHAALCLTVSLIDDVGIADNDQTIYVYGITNQALDNVALTNGLPWANAPGNNAASAYAADLGGAKLLGTFALDGNGGKAAPTGTVIRFSSEAFVDFINADSNDKATFILGRTGTSDDKNLLFAGDSHGTYDTARLLVDDMSPSVVNTGKYVEASTGDKVYTLSFNAGATANKLVVVLTAESNAGAGAVHVTYNGVALTAAYKFTAAEVGVYYLDNPYTGGAADLTVDCTSVTTVNGVGFAAVSLSGAAAGDASAVATDSGTPLDVDINVPSPNSFVIAGFNANGSGATSANFSLAQIFGENIGSAEGSAGYENGVPAGNRTCKFASTATPRWITAAAFSPRAKGTIIIIK